MKIRFLYSDDCPSHEKALQRLRESIEAEGIRAKVEVLKVDTEEKAEKLKYVGSPTIIVNGHDIDPPQTPQYAVTCRAYRLDDGRISPMPPEAMIREALRQARAKES